MSAEKAQAEKSDQNQTAGMPFRRVILTNVIRFLSWIILRLHFENVENIPPSGGLLVVTNHMSQVDSAILLLNPVRKDMAAVIADNYKKHPFIHFIVNSMPHVYIDRSRADFSALKSAVDYLKQGHSLGIAPEGTRSKTGSLIEGKLGAAFMAVRANAPIVAVGITGTENFRKNIMRLKRTPVNVHYGKPFLLPPLDPEDRSGSLQRATDEIMYQIAAQLPEKYHGVYAGHPRIRELKDTQ